MNSRLRSGAAEVALSTVVAVAAVVVGLLVVLVAGESPTAAASSFFSGAFGGNSIGATVRDMIPLTLVALGWIVVFKAGRFHVGFQGQLLIGGLFSVIVALEVSGLPTVVHLPLAVVAGCVGGALWAWAAAVLWAKRGVNEIVSTLLLNLVAIQVISWVVRGPLQEPTRTLPQTQPLPDSALWPLFPDQTILKWDVVLIPLGVALVTFALSRTTLGFSLRLVGANPTAARYSGVSPVRVGTWAIVTSGALAGLAGSSQALGVSVGGMTDGFDSGFGFQGIAVALLARNSPVAVIPAALLFAALRQGGGVAQAEIGVSSAIVDVMQGVVIVSVIAAAAWLAMRRGAATAGEPLAREATPLAFGEAR